MAFLFERGSLVWVGLLGLLTELLSEDFVISVHVVWLSGHILWELVRSVTFLVWPSMCLATLWPSTGFCIGSSITWSSLYCGRGKSSTWCKLLWLNFIFPTSLFAFSASSFHRTPSRKSLLLVQKKVRKQLGSAFLRQAFWQSWPLASAWELGFGEVPIISHLILSLCLNCLYKWCGLCRTLV